MPRLIFLVYGTVTFNYQLRFSTVEISDVITELMLSPKFEAEQFTIAE
jgi:hypothetical protein